MRASREWIPVPEQKVEGADHWEDEKNKGKAWQVRRWVGQIWSMDGRWAGGQAHTLGHIPLCSLPRLSAWCDVQAYVVVSRMVPA